VEENIGAVALQTVWEQRVKGCTRCKLSETRKQIVFGAGNPERPDYVFKGLGPGVDEDRVGIPFIGKAGQLFNKMLKAMGINRADIYVCNAIACRSWDSETGKDVDPSPECVRACVPVWTSQLVAVRPRIIVAMGAVAGNAILGTEDKTVGEMRKKFHSWRNIPVQVTYHPAGMLYQPELKPLAWEDLQSAMLKLEEVKLKENDHGPLFG
jgi:DNA polymerase